MRRHLTRVLRWYTTPSGLVFALIVVLAAVGLASFDWNWIPRLLAIAALAVFIPVKFSSQTARIHAVSSRQRSDHRDSLHAVATAERDQTTRRRLAVADIKDRIGLVEHEARSVGRTTDELGERLDAAETTFTEEARGLKGDADEVATRIAHLESNLDALAELAAAQRSLKDSIESQEESLTKVRDRLVRERHQRIADFARRDSSGQYPDRITLLVTVPRSGSTWAYDMIRFLDSVFVEPSSMVWDSLGLEGRRYPAALSDGPSGDLSVEVTKGVGSRIPSVGSAIESADIAIEKLHPEFFAFSAEALTSRLDQLADHHPGVEPSLVFLIRNPLEVMWSMVRYKQRDKTWYPKLADDQIPVFIARTFDTINDLAAKRSGLICDYAELQSSDEAVASLFRHVDPRLGNSAEGLVELARAANSREAKQKNQRRPFLGSQMKRRLHDFTGPGDAWADRQDSITHALEVYEQLLARSHR